MKETEDKMKLVIMALLPAGIFGVWNFGISALILMLVCVGSAVLTEYLYEKCRKKPITISDYSAVVTGLLLAFNLPPSFPWYLAVLGSVFGILVVKQLFGGRGQNFMNPALAARCFLLISFPVKMTEFIYQGLVVETPLLQMRAGESVNALDLFLGTTSGTIGETSAVCLLLGALFLIIMDVIDVDIPLFYLGSFLLFMLIFGNDVEGMNRFHYLCAQICSGGILLGVWFMATDEVTAPASRRGKQVYGIILGILTGLFRVLTDSVAGVSFAIIFGNLLVPLIEEAALKKAFDKGGEK